MPAWSPSTWTRATRQPSYPPYQFAKEKDKIRFPIRVQDTSRNAGLRDIEYLFAKRSSLAQTTEERVQRFFTEYLFPQILKDFDGPPQPEHTARPFHVWFVRPRMPIRLRFDRSFDRYASSL